MNANWRKKIRAFGWNQQKNYGRGERRNLFIRPYLFLYHDVSCNITQQLI